MNISQRDVMLLLTMGLAVVSMSFVFPALGLADESVSENEIPEFNVEPDRFEFAGEAPPAPGSPRTDELTWDDSRDDQFNQVWLEGDTTGGVEVALLPPDGDNATESDPLQITINEWDSGSVSYTERLNFTSEGQERVLINESLGYEMTFESLTVDGDAGVYEVRYDIRSQVVDSGWLSNVPVLGSAVEAGQATAATLGWFIEIAIWAIQWIFQLIGNAVAVGADVGVYLVTLITWLATTYASIVASANSWVAVFVALPGILLSAVLAKLVIIAVGLLPTT